MVLAAFALLGLLIGVLVGISAESTLSVILPLLFAFGGGSAVAYLHKLTKEEVRQASAAVVALCLACLVGLGVGIVTAERQLLTPLNQREALSERRGTIEARKYLRSQDLNYTAHIDERYKSHLLSPEQAYDSLYQYLARGTDR